MSITSQGAKEQLLGSALRDLIYVNERREGNVVSKNTDQKLELDYFIKDLKLAFEYQDPHHYISTWYYQKSKHTIANIDNILILQGFHVISYLSTLDMKQKVAEEQGISFIRVPCWWDGTRDSLVATIKKRRPEVLKNYPIPPSCVAISDEPPPNHFFGVYERWKESSWHTFLMVLPSVYEIPGIGELMAPVFPPSSFQPNSWWLSEKYDGVRGCWVHTDSVLYLFLS